ncbi:hypothetical protein O1611_g7587 [Lasiodiplodia mahajangana]|uniref:Uncharacterized protein n=1 Tax=Lasiodiplodia mahajangana TaxID=1108764 RepID=A0ACC2JEX5_9PEZI|nr:hypothetical protein O1611_g7587 [Lasiodiplodia mahajangana]
MPCHYFFETIRDQGVNSEEEEEEEESWNHSTGFFQPFSITTSSAFPSKLRSQLSLIGSKQMNSKLAWPVINEPCEKCTAKETSYTTLQLRGADEGTTVFYYCRQCGHRTLNRVTTVFDHIEDACRTPIGHLRKAEVAAIWEIEADVLRQFNRMVLMAMTYPSGQRILIIGAGELGTAMLEGLVQRSECQLSPVSPSITILLRASTISSVDSKKAQANAYLRSLGASLAAGDIVQDSEEHLANIFQSYDAIIACSGFGFPSGTQLRVTRAVLRAGVKRYFPWQWGIDYDVVGAGSAQDLFDEQLEVRKLLRAQDKVDWVVVSTGFFIFVPEFGPVDLKGRTLRALGSWDKRLSVTTPRDIGRVTAEILYEPREIHRQVVFVAGDTVSYGDVADLVARRFGGQWKRELWDMQTLEQRLKANPNDGMVKYQNVFGAGKGVAWDMATTVNMQRGMGMQTVEDYLREMKDLD